MLLVEISRKIKSFSPHSKLKSSVVAKRKLFIVLAQLFVCFTCSTYAWAQEAQTQIRPQWSVEDLRNFAKGPAQFLRWQHNATYMGDLNFTTKDGKEIKFRNFSGKVLLVALWSYYCGPCRRELPELSKLSEQLKGASFAVLPINIDENKTDIPSLFQQLGVELPWYRDTAAQVLDFLRVRGLVFGVPVTLVIDKNGFLLASYNGLFPWKEGEVKNFLQELIKK